MIDKFTIRVYGLWIKDRHILVCHEKIDGVSFTKFPGGRLEFGEGLQDCLYREFLEETGITLKTTEHFYTTDFFQQSAFRKNEQLIAVYFKVFSEEKLPATTVKEIREGKSYTINHQWISLSQFSEEMVTFPIDKLVAKKLKKELA